MPGARVMPQLLLPLLLLSCSHAGQAAPPVGQSTIQVTSNGVTLSAGNTELTPRATAYLAWRHTNQTAWSESYAPALENVRERRNGTSFIVSFPEVRAEIRIERLRTNLWRLSGKIRHIGKQPIELARFHYLDGIINADFSLLGIPGGHSPLPGSNTTHVVKAGDSLPAPRSAFEKGWEKSSVRFPALSEPIHDAPDWAVSRDTGVFSAAWDQPGWTVGFTGPGTAFGEIGFHTRPAPLRFFIGVLLDNILLEPGETRVLENALLYYGDWQEGMKAWAQECAREFKVPTPKPPMIGYCSYYQRYLNVEVKDLLRAANELKDYPTPPGGKTVQVDDGWMIKPGDWFPNAKFAADWKTLPERIRQTGALPGTYLIPTAVHESNPLVKEHPEWFQRLPNGEFAVHFANWGEKTYFLELDRPEVKAFMRAMVERARDEGWGYIKFDFTYALSTARVAYDRKKTSFETQHDLYALLRKAAGPKMRMNACVGHPARYALGLVDLNRLGGDITTRWEAVRKNLPKVLTLAATSGIGCQGDPDVFFMRKCGLSPEERYLLTGTIALFGGVFITSDWPSQWSPAAQATMREFWTATGPQPPMDQRVFWSGHGIPLAYRVTHTAKRAQRHQVGIYNWSDKAEDIRVPLKDVGLDENAAWHVSASLRDQGIRLEDKSLVFKVQPPHSLRIANLSAVSK